MRVLVAGAGAVGSWFGAALADGGARVTLVARGPHVAAVTADGLHRVSEDSIETFDVAAFDSIAGAASNGPFDVTIVAVKSYHTAGVAAELVSAGVHGPVISVQNGVGNEAILDAVSAGRDLPTGVARARVPTGSATPIIAATLTTAVDLIQPGVVERLGGGTSGVGLARGGDPAVRDLPAAADALAAALADGGLIVRRYSDPDSMKWSKLLLNMLGSASCAILQRTPDEVLARRDVFSIELRAWREALSVMRALGVHAVALPGYPVDRFAAAAGALPGPILAALFSRRLARARGSRLPGTAADMVAGRIESEVHAMHGVIADAGKALGIETPVCAALRDLVDGIARGRLPAERFIGRPDALVEAIRPSSPAS